MWSAFLSTIKWSAYPITDIACDISVEVYKCLLDIMDIACDLKHNDWGHLYCGKDIIGSFFIYFWWGDDLIGCLMSK